MAKAKRTYEKPLKLDMEIDEALGRIAQTDPIEVETAMAESVDDRVRLVEREGLAHPLLIYATNKGIEVALPYTEYTLWADQDQIADMFGVTRPNVSIHLKNIFEQGELDEPSTCKESLRVGATGQQYTRKLYNLNAIISVGYRVGSKQGTMFRIWATDRIVQILTKGFYVDVDRMKNEGAPDVLEEFRDIARKIRTSIRNSYREVLKLCTLCSDYDGSSGTAREFFMDMENKLLWASSGKTAPQLILERCDAEAVDVGLTYYAGKRGPTQKDVLVGNNYLAVGESDRKNRITEMWLTYVEEQLDQGRLPTMAAVREKMVGFIKFNQWSLLIGKGHHSRDDADAHALEQLEVYRERTKALAEAGEPTLIKKARGKASSK